MLSNNLTPTSIEELLNKLRSSQPLKVENEELKAFKKFAYKNEYDYDCLCSDHAHILSDYVKHRQESQQSKQLRDRIVSMINGQVPSTALLPEPKYNKANKFNELIDLPKRAAARDQTGDIDRFFPQEFKYLLPLERLCYANNKPLSEYLVTGYHQSGLSVNEYNAENHLLNELKQVYNFTRRKEVNQVTEMITNYLLEYEKAVSKPLAHYSARDVRPYKDNIRVIMNYMNEINNGLKNLLSDNASYPIQLDVFFVAPGQHTDKGLHQISDCSIKSDTATRRNGAVDAVADIYKLFRQTANRINKKHHQRFIMLIVRANPDDSYDDTVYIYQPADDRYKYIADKTFSDPVELLYLINSKQDIVANLPSTSAGILGWNHHLHSAECNKIYLSYGNYKSRVFKGDLLSKLELLFDRHNGRRHYIPPATRQDFMKDYIDLDDIRYFELGEYWFNIAKQYECYHPYWNPSNCRAMGNVYIPKSKPSCTQDLLAYIDEEFESPEKLYYKMDYTIGMQIVDKQTIAIKFGDDYFKQQHRGKTICLINTELHRNAHKLYAVIEENKFKSKQRWKIVDYDHISKAFMTAQQLRDEYGIFTLDLPKGSKRVHNQWAQQIADIKVTKQLIRNTNWSHIRIIQSKQNLGKLGIHDDASQDGHEACGVRKGARMNGNHSRYKAKHKLANSEERQDVICISETRFKQLAIKSLQRQSEKAFPLIPSAHFKFRKNKYHIELLLPVYIPEHKKYVAISFWNNQLPENKRVQATGVCLDLTDMKNKANLIGNIPADSWLSQATDEMTINNLTIGGTDSPPTNTNGTKQDNTHNNNENKKAKKKKSKKNKKRKDKKNGQTLATYNHSHSPPATPQINGHSTPPQMTPMSSATDSPAPMPVFVPSKVPSVMLPPQMQVPMMPMQPAQQQQFAPPMLATSSIGSVTSTTSSLPSLSAMNSIPSIPMNTASTCDSSSLQQSIILQGFQQAEYFARFLPPLNTYNACNVSAQSSVPMANVYYVTTPLALQSTPMYNSNNSTGTDFQYNAAYMQSYNAYAPLQQ
eukprot:CAMPEP_0197022160 /NCGR_PEP_ID=MMETSP1384-20130603/3060_1 /TAXON_ID=29189 /ORGANISM="Ammonia sp." /LENGTH=1041 /DNA_ID=CAMNT_0042450139 /DNA_START=64 /DNA_END=3189 /DNA_ORIENTATION=+